MASSPSHQWIVDRLHPFEYDVASLVPPVFDAYARVFHPAYTYSETSPDGVPVTWHEIAKANGRVAHPAMEWGSLLGTWNSANYRGGLQHQSPDEGTLPVAVANELSHILKQFTSTDRVMYALWNGYGIEVKDAELIELPERPMYVIEGSIDSAANPFGLGPENQRTANLWWDCDQKWCVATEIDLVTTYVGGSHDCIEAILNNDLLEAMPVTSSQRITWDADTLNPLPDHPLTGHKHF